jgi:hypothetical protein
MFKRVVIYIENQLKLGRIFSVLLLHQIVFKITATVECFSVTAGGI